MLLKSILVIMRLLARNFVSAQTKVPLSEAENATTCLEFVNNTTLDIDKLVDVDWKIFYFWNPEVETSYVIKFSRPSTELIKRFQVELDKDLKPPANWSKAVLFMETHINLSALLLKTLIPGIFRMIPSTAFEYNVPTELLIFGIKLVDPGYLGISNCKLRLCYALAPVDKMPYHYELEKAAKTLNFYSPYNRSHIAQPLKHKGIPYSSDYGADVPDDNQEEDLEIEEDMSKLEFF